MTLPWFSASAVVCRVRHLEWMRTVHANSLWTATGTTHGSDGPQLTSATASGHSKKGNSSHSGSVVYVYRGPGSSSQCYDHMFHSLSRCLNHTVLGIDAESIIKGEWRHKCAAIVFGGGRTGGYVQAFGNRGAQNVRDYVLGGGTYVGVCAGAYLACDLVSFRQKGQSRVVVERPLNFYPGICEGPVNEDFDPKRSPPAHICSQPVSFLLRGGPHNVKQGGHDVIAVHDVIPVNVYVNGGGTFRPHDHHRTTDASDPSVEVLAHFDKTCRAAVVKCQVGEGVAILSSPHLEMTSHSDDVTGESCWQWVLSQGKLNTSASGFFVSSSISGSACSSAGTCRPHSWRAPRKVEYG